MAKYANQLQAAVKLTSSLVLGANANRVGLLIGCSPNSRLYVSFGAPAVVQGSIMIPSNNIRSLFDDNNVGDLIHMDIFMIAESALSTIGIVELIDTECGCKHGR